MAVLVLTTEPPPLAGMVATGAGIRAWSLAAGLAAGGLEVTLAVPAALLAGVEVAHPWSPLGSPLGAETPPPDGAGPLRVTGYDRTAIADFVRAQAPEVLVSQHWGLLAGLGEPSCPLAIDLAGPHLLERLFWKSPRPQSDRAEKVKALSRADFVTCSGRWQRHYFLPFLQWAGWDLADTALCPVIPFSFAPRPPGHGAPPPDPAAFTHGGMFLPWQDPEQGLSALLTAMEEAGRGVLHVYGGPHPAGDVSGGKGAGFRQTLAAHGRVVWHGQKPFDQLSQDYWRYGVALDALAHNWERELAFTSRTVIYLAHGLPVIYNDYSELSALIGEYDAGWLVSPDDRAGLGRVCREALDSPALVAEKGRNALRLVGDRLRYDATIAPLLAFCRRPRFRADKMAAPLEWVARERRLVRLEKEAQVARSRWEALQGKWIYRLYARRGWWARLAAPVAAPLVGAAAALVALALWLTRRPDPR